MLHHVNSNQFPSQEFPQADADVVIDKSVHAWTNYFMAGYKVREGGKGERRERGRGGDEKGKNVCMCGVCVCVGGGR